MVNPQRATALGVAVANVIAKKTNSSNEITMRIICSSAFIFAARRDSTVFGFSKR